jgi:serine/threonine protein kinase
LPVVKENVVSIVCPHCKHTLNLKNIKPGRYTPKCPKCAQPFQVTVPDAPDQPPIVRAIPAKAKTDETPSTPGSSAKMKKAAPPPEAMPAVDPFATGAPVPVGDTRPAVPAPKPAAASAKASSQPLEATLASATVAPGAAAPEATLALEAAGQAGAVPEATVALPAAPAPEATGAFAPAAPEEPNATGAYGEAAAQERPATSVPESAEAAPAKAPADEVSDADIPNTLGGYEVLKRLGKGGMGAVYLGRQISLDRPVALKVMSPRWARDPDFVARFTREAYAAAQLVHHNVVQIYDIGAERDTNFFSMEFVNGQSLMDLVRKEGKLDPEVAVGYVLQAARGLKFGHDMGMIHRDVKPDNLMVNDQGIVKVADLGLVKTPGTTEAPAAPPREGTPASPSSHGLLSSVSDLTRAGIAMGTPTYMAPEQARDATKVDARADIYSLGCTLYILLTGKPPFSGKTVLEVLTKHATEPIVPPEVIVKRVPKSLSIILLKMMAKRPEDRYANMGEVIDVLEKYLGIQQTGPFTPREEHALLLEECVEKFNGVPKARLRKHVLLGFFGGCALLTLLCTLLVWPVMAGTFLGLGLLTGLSYFIVQGVTEKSYLFGKVREFALGSSWSDWLLGLVGVAVFLLLLYLFQLLWVWIVVCGLAVGLSLGVHFWLDQQIAQQRAAPIAETEKLIKSMRLQGLEEQALRQFVCKYSGRRWEEFYEALFGYEAKLAAREWVRGEAGKGREKFAAWREPVVRWIEARQQARHEAQQRKHLKAVEAKALKAKGMAAAEAEQKAGQMAEKLVATAAEIKAEIKKEATRAATAAPTRAAAAAPTQAVAPEATQAYVPGQATAPRSSMKDLLATAQNPETAYTGTETKPRSFNPAAFVFGQLLGAKVRFVLGAALVAGCLMWIHQNDLIKWEKLQALGQQIAQKKELQGANLGEMVETQATEIKPLQLPMVPAFLTDLFDSFNPGVAGLILLISGFFRGWRMSLLVLPGAALAFLGHRCGVPDVGPVAAPYVSMAGGLVLALLGFIFLREGEKAKKEDAWRIE